MPLNINSNTLVEDYDFVWRLDPALDHDHAEFDDKYQEYMSTGDLTVVPLKAGQTPLLWRLRHLKGRSKKRIMDQFNASGQKTSFELLWDACAVALAGVTGLKTGDGGDASIDIVESNGLLRVAESDMEVLDENFPGLVESIGLKAITRSSPDPK